jgi:hypothetical protein
VGLPRTFSRKILEVTSRTRDTLVAFLPKEEMELCLD